MTNGDYKFRMEVPDVMISDAIKKKAGYTYYMAKKVESEKAKIIDEPEEQHVSLVKSGRGKGFMYYGDQVASVPNKLKKDVVPRKTRSLTIAEELVIGPAVEDPSVQSLLDLRNGSKASRLESLRQKKQPDAGEGSSAAHNKYYDSSDTNNDATLYTSSSDESEESENETDDTDEPDMDLFNDNPNRDDDAAGLAQDLPPVYIDAQTTLVVHNPEGNPELTSYISDENAHQLSSPPVIKTPYPTTTPQPNSLQAKAKKLMQKAKKNMRKINFKKAVAKKFREYDQKLEALTNFNVSESFEKAVQAKVLTEIKKLLPTHIPNAIANYVRPHIDKDENHILGPSTVAIAKKLKAIIQKDELTIADLEGAGLERLNDEDEVSKSRTFERHMSKNTKPRPSFYNNDFYYLVCLSTEKKYTTSITKHYAARYYKQGIEDMIPDRWCKETHRYIFEALNGIHHWDGDRIDFFKEEMSTRTEELRRFDDKEYEFSYADLPRLSLNDVEDMYLLQVQDKLHHLPLEFVKDFNNALLIFIRRVVIQNRVEDIQLGMESYQQTLNLTKPMMLFKGIDQKIPFTMSGTHKGVVYLNQHNAKSFMKLSEVKKFCDGTLNKIRENLIDIVTKNKLGTGNKRLKGRD
ncbi:hypothetical protein Tco_0646254 [Tanacetum coccineum]